MPFLAERMGDYVKKKSSPRKSKVSRDNSPTKSTPRKTPITKENEIKYKIMKTEVIKGDTYGIEDDELNTYECPPNDLSKIKKRDLDEYLLSNVKTTIDENGAPVEIKLSFQDPSTKP